MCQSQDFVSSMKSNMKQYSAVNICGTNRGKVILWILDLFKSFSHYFIENVILSCLSCFKFEIIYRFNKYKILGVLTLLVSRESHPVLL